MQCNEMYHSPLPTTFLPPSLPNPPLHLFLLHLRQSFLERLQRLLDIASALIRHTDTHMPKPDILGRDLLVQSACKHDALFHQAGQDLRRRHSLGKVYRRHRVSLVLGLAG